MPLTDTAIRNAKPGEKTRKLAAEKGLYLELNSKGGKWWRLRYRFQGREKLLSLGVYPDVSLAKARERRDEARRLIASGVDPSAARKAEKASRATAGANSFEAIAREWYETRRGDWSEKYGERLMRRLEVDVFPYIGGEPVAGITPPQLLEVLRRIERRGVVETAHRALDSSSQVFRYAIATGRAESDPGRDLKDALKRPTPKHFPAITKPERLAELLRAVDDYKGTPVVRAALQLAPMLLVRPGELRHAAPDEFDLEGALWTIPPGRMKRTKAGKLQGDPHLVPLPRQAVAVC
jgi:integrase